MPTDHQPGAPIYDSLIEEQGDVLAAAREAADGVRAQSEDLRKISAGPRTDDADADAGANTRTYTHPSTHAHRYPSVNASADAPAGAGAGADAVPGLVTGAGAGADVGGGEQQHAVDAFPENV